MIATSAIAQTASTTAGAAAPSFLQGPIGSLLPFIAIFVLFYFMLIRPQQQRAKAHRAMVAALKRGDTVVLANGMIGKVTRVEENEVMVEIAQGVNTRVVRGLISEVRTRGEIASAANDSKS
ncbi:MAG TPA: preprotein translocase subunit YajC [Caulobacteraceae bacterium]|jgi:preprotein translocase subunit YajC